MIASTSFRALGTTALVAVPRRVDLLHARGILSAQLEELDRACSRFRADSQLSLVNRRAGELVHVGRLLADAVDAALAAARATDGLVDPTLGANMRAAGYDRTFELVQARDSWTVQPAPHCRSAWTQIEVDRTTSRIRIPQGCELDLGATAKALAADRAATTIATALESPVLVSLGGDIAVAGGAEWPIRIAERHDAPLDGDGPCIALAHGGLATSSTTVRRWRTDHGDAHHLIDPKHGPPRTHVLARASASQLRPASRRTSPRRPRCCSAKTRSAGCARAATRAGSSRTTAASSTSPAGLRRRRRRDALVRHARLAASSRCYCSPRRSCSASSRRCAGAPTRWPRFATVDVHRNLTLLSIVFVAIHVVTTVADGYAPVGLIDAVVPFLSPYRPVWLGLGTVAFDLLLALVVTSLFRSLVPARAWRALHWAAYAAWPVALVHSLGTGSDARTAWLQAIGVGSLVAVALAVLARIALGGGLALPRLAGTVAAILVPVGVIAWYHAGPLHPGWAKKSGTPTTILARKSTQSQAASLASVDSVEPTSFSAPVSGTITTSQAAAGYELIDISLRLGASPHGAARIRLRGVPQNGGVVMTASGVTFVPQTTGTVYSGTVSVALRAPTSAPSYGDAGGATLNLSFSLSIDNATGTVSGTRDDVVSAVLAPRAHLAALARRRRCGSARAARAT